MKIIVGMPEILVLYSALMYTQSYGISIFALVLGLMSRFAMYGQEVSKQKELAMKKEDTSQSIEDAVSSLIGAFSDKD